MKNGIVSRWGVTVDLGAVLGKPESAKKAWGLWPLLLFLACILVVDISILPRRSFAGWKDRECVLLLEFNTHERANNGVAMTRFSNWNEDTFTLSTSLVASNPDYIISPSLGFYFWDPTYTSQGRWRHQVVGTNYLWMTKNVYLRFKEYPTIQVGLDPSKLYPNGCSDLPSQQPEQNPNPDPGDPKCNDQGL